MPLNSSGDAATVGIEITPLRFVSAIVGQDGTILSKSEASRRDSTDAGREIAEFAREIYEKSGSRGPIGVALPGLIDHVSGRVAHSERMPENMSIEFRALFREIGLDVILENDANAAAYGEYLAGAGRGASSLFYAMIDLGVGGAFIFDGRVWRGSSGFAGEFGYVAINEDGVRLEDVASADNIVRRTLERLNRDSTSSLGRLNEEEIGIAEIISAANDGDDLAILMLQRTGHYIGTAVASVINLLNVEKIILGGQVIEAGEHILGAITERAAALSFEPAFNATSIFRSELGRDAAAIGAALIARDA